MKKIPRLEPKKFKTKTSDPNLLKKKIKKKLLKLYRFHV